MMNTMPSKNSGIFLFNFFYFLIFLVISLTLPSPHPYPWIIFFGLCLWPLSLLLENLEGEYREKKEFSWANEEFSFFLFRPRKMVFFLLLLRTLFSLCIPLIYLLGILFLRWSNLGQEKFYWDSLLGFLGIIYSYPFVQPFLLLLLYLAYNFQKTLRLWLKQECSSVYWSLLSSIYFFYPSLEEYWLTLVERINHWTRKSSFLDSLISSLVHDPSPLLWLGSFSLGLEFLLTRGSLFYSSIITFLTFILYLLFSLYSFLFFLERSALFAPEALLRNRPDQFPMEEAKEWAQNLGDMKRWDILGWGHSQLYLPRFQRYFPSWVFWKMEDGKDNSSENFFLSLGHRNGSSR